MSTQGSPLFAEVLRRGRARYGLTQAEVAHRMGITSATLSEREAGRSPIGEAFMARAAEAMGVSLAELLTAEIAEIERAG